MQINRASVVSRDGLSFLLMVIALIIFILTAFDAHPGDLSPIEQTSLGLAFLAGGVLA